MSDWDLAERGTLGQEGGYVNNRADRGGPTNFGVTAATLGDWRHLGRPATAAEVQALTLEEAHAIYRARYWLEPHIDQIRDNRLAAKVFDIGVNSGPAEAVKLLQRAIDHVAPPGVARVRDDGDLGPKTLASLAACDPDLVLKALVSEQKLHYLAIIEDEPSQAVFKSDWLRRAEWIPGEAA